MLKDMGNDIGRLPRYGFHGNMVVSAGARGSI